MKFWQYMALVSGAIIAVVMALASISYNSTLGTLEPAFTLLPITNRSLFSALALAFDLGMIASVFGFWHWRKRELTCVCADSEASRRHRLAALICVTLFVIASLFSIHSVRGYIALNITKSLAPMERSKDIYSSMKVELHEAQNHLRAMRSSLIKARGRRRTRLGKEVAAQLILVRETRARLASSKITTHVTPLAGLEWFLAVTLWFFNATCWTAWFGPGAGIARVSTKLDHCDQSRAQGYDQNGIHGWLETYRQSEPEHCALLYERYCEWCQENAYQPLVNQSFYSRLGKLGTRKSRAGRDGPTLYSLPQRLMANSGS